MNPPDFRGLENFEVVIFLGPSFCEILGGGVGEGFSGIWYFLAHKLQHKKLTFYFLYLYFTKI